MANSTEVKRQRSEANKERGDAEAMVEILRASGKYTEEQLTGIEDQLVKSGPDDAITAELTAARAALDATPEGKARLRDIMSQRKAERLSTKFAPLFQAVLAGSDIATSIGQIGQAKRGLRNLKSPAMPPVPGIDPLLNQSIRDAQTGTYDSARITGQAKQELNDQYAKDIALAKSIGGGQASTLGALGQVASMRKQRGIASLVPLSDAARAREEGRLDNLIGQRGSLIDQNYRNRFYQYRGLQDQYNTEAQALGGLGAAGRTNLRSSVQNLLGAVPGVAARVGLNGYGSPVDQYEQSLNLSLTNNQPVSSPYSQLRRGPAIGYPGVNDPMTGEYRPNAYRPRIY